MLREKLGNNVNSKILQCLIKKAAIPTLLRGIRAYTLERVQTERANNFKAYTTFLGQADAAQDTWLEELAGARAVEELKQPPQSKRKQSRRRRSSSDDNRTEEPLKKATADQLRQLRDIERICASARRVKTALSVNWLARITMVEVPTRTVLSNNSRIPTG
jgi:hypothetical protein